MNKSLPIGFVIKVHDFPCNHDQKPKRKIKVHTVGKRIVVKIKVHTASKRLVVWKYSADVQSACCVSQKQEYDCADLVMLCPLSPV